MGKAIAETKGAGAIVDVGRAGAVEDGVEAEGRVESALFMPCRNWHEMAIMVEFQQFFLLETRTPSRQTAFKKARLQNLSDSTCRARILAPTTYPVP